MMDVIAQVTGWIGMFLCLVAYFLVTIGKIDVKSRAYQWLNLVGAVGLGINVFHEQAWPAFVLEIVWGAIAVVTLLTWKRKVVS